MSRTVAVVLGLTLMITLIVGLDIASLRDRFALRLIVNVAIVLAFGAFYALLSRRP